MPSGSVQLAIVCKAGSVPSGSSAALYSGAVAIRCVMPDGTNGYTSLVNSYLIDQSASVQFDQALQPFDPVAAGGYFSFAFTMTITVWVMAYKAGAVIDFLRRW